jgi:hypothetical protein
MPASRHARAVMLATLTSFGSALLPATILAQTAPTTRKVETGTPTSAIYIGNSFFYYNNGIHSQVGQLAAAAKSRIRGTMVTISGSGMDWHDVGSYFRPNAIASYSFNTSNEIVFNRFNKPFDVAVIMDCSQCPIHPKLQSVFQDFAKKNSDTVRQHGAEPVLFMSWAYADKPEMTAQLAEQYTLAGNANRALVIPAGLAFARAIDRQPTINLYAPDKRHPSPAGTYLAACTVFASLLKQSPVGLSYAASLDAPTAAFLQQVAWDTVQAYHGN